MSKLYKLYIMKVREKLLSKQKAVERSEKARKLREIKKFGKKVIFSAIFYAMVLFCIWTWQVQREVLQKRQKEKKEALEAVKKYRKGESIPCAVF